jgi:hypothetical protein
VRRGVLGIEEARMRAIHREELDALVANAREAR